jgi:hypothetical protein
MVLSFASCAVCILSMRKEPNHRAEQVNQMLFGERAEILKINEDFWAYIRCFEDNYEGWCLLGQLKMITKREFNKAPKYLSKGFGNQLITSETNIILPMGACLHSSIHLGVHKAKYKGQKLMLSSINTSVEEIERTALLFKFSPYLWGGRSREGIDCSGFSQLVFRMNGISIERDASQQAKQGETITFLQETRCGDLAFFGNIEGKINHVGIILDEHHIIHATETAGYVVIDKIDQEGIVSKLLRKRTHTLRLIKRYF